MQQFEGRALGFLPEAADKHWHLWMQGRKVLGFEGKGLGGSWESQSGWEITEWPGITSQTGMGHEEKPLRGLWWPGRFGWYSQSTNKIQIFLGQPFCAVRIRGADADFAVRTEGKNKTPNPGASSGPSASFLAMLNHKQTAVNPFSPAHSHPGWLLGMPGEFPA